MQHLQNALTLSRAKVVEADSVGEVGASAMELHLQSAMQGTLATINEQAEASVATLVADPASLNTLATLVEASAGDGTGQEQLVDTVDAIMAVEGGETAAWRILERYVARRCATPLRTAVSPAHPTSLVWWLQGHI